MDANTLENYIAGALYDFMGELTTGEELVVSGSRHPGHLLDRFKEWARRRGLDVEQETRGEPMVERWNVALASRRLLDSLGASEAVEATPIETWPWASPPIQEAVDQDSYEARRAEGDMLDRTYATPPFTQAEAVANQAINEEAPPIQGDVAGLLDDLEQTARFLFDRLDDIDTADDQAKGDDAAFRMMVRGLQKRRWEVGTVNGDAGEDVTFNWPPRADGTVPKQSEPPAHGAEGIAILGGEHEIGKFIVRAYRSEELDALYNTLQPVAARQSYQDLLDQDGANVIIEGAVDGWVAILQEHDVPPADRIEVEDASVPGLLAKLDAAYRDRQG